MNPQAAAHYNRGVGLRDQGRHAEAEAAFRQALALEPGNALALNNLGIVLDAGREAKTALPLAAAIDVIGLAPDLGKQRRTLDGGLRLGLHHPRRGNGDAAIGCGRAHAAISLVRLVTPRSTKNAAKARIGRPALSSIPDLSATRLTL